MKVAPVSALVRVLRCPLCEQRFDGLRSDAVRADFKCQRAGCPQHWWAMGLAPGLVLPQLAAVVDELAPELLGIYQLPARLEVPMFWQLSLSGRQAREREDVRRAGRTPDPVPSHPSSPERYLSGCSETSFSRRVSG